MSRWLRIGRKRVLDTRPDWRDPDMPVLRSWKEQDRWGFVTEHSKMVSPQFSQELSAESLDNSNDGKLSWRDDKTYFRAGEKLVIPPQKVTLHSVTGQAIEAQFTIVRKLQIDFVNLENVPMVFLDAAPFDELDLADKPAMLLGMRMLRMFDRVAIDFGARHVDFQMPQTRNEDDKAERLLAAAF